MKLLNRNLISNAVLVAALVVGGAGSAAAQDADDPMAFIRGAQSWADNCHGAITCATRPSSVTTSGSQPCFTCESERA